MDVMRITKLKQIFGMLAVIGRWAAPKQRFPRTLRHTIFMKASDDGCTSQQARKWRI